MDVDSQGIDGTTRRAAHHRHGNDSGKTPKVCYQWRAGKCKRLPCPYLHRETPPAQTQIQIQNGSNSGSGSQSQRRGANSNGGASSSGRGNGGNRAAKKTERVCSFWVQGSCGYGDSCRFLHSWTIGNCFSLLAQLEGHSKVVTGIALPCGSDKMYTGSKDGTVRVWDCQSGQCTGVINVGGEVGSMISEGPWIFVGLPNVVKAWNMQALAELSLSGPVGQVYAMVAGDGLFFAGTQDGSILAWKCNVISNSFDPAASLTGHTLGVCSFVVGANRLYSSSMDHSIKVWNLETLQCMQTLTGHTNVVMSILCWDQFLLSCSLDKTIKVWAAKESGDLEVMYTHKEEHGMLALCGTNDFEAKSVLLCSCNDNSVRAFDLPTFSERGKIFGKQEIRAVRAAPGGLLLTGDGAGQVRVWKWSPERAVMP